MYTLKYAIIWFLLNNLILSILYYIILLLEALNKLMGKDTLPSETKLFNLILCPFKGKWPRAACIKGQYFETPVVLLASLVFNKKSDFCPQLTAPLCFT